MTTLPLDVEDYFLAHLLRTEMDAKGVPARDIADSATKRGRPISHATLVNIKNYKSPVGDKARKALLAYFDLSAAQLEARAKEWAEENPDELKRAPAPPVETIEVEDRYANRARAIVAARALGHSDEAIERIASVELKSNADLEPRQWLSMIEAEDNRRRFLAPNDSRPVTAEPEPPRRSRAELAAEAQRRNAEEADKPRKTGLPPPEKKPKKP